LRAVVFRAPAARSGTVCCTCLELARPAGRQGSPDGCSTVFKQLGGPHAATLGVLPPDNSIAAPLGDTSIGQLESFAQRSQRLHRLLK